jgi:hypothetical protein
MATTSGSATISTTEYSIPAGANYAEGSPQTTHRMVQLYLRGVALALGDVFEVREYATINGAQVRVAATTLTYGEPGAVLPACVVSSGWDRTLVKIAGTDRVWHWNLEHLAVT